MPWMSHDNICVLQNLSKYFHTFLHFYLIAIETRLPIVILIQDRRIRNADFRLKVRWLVFVFSLSFFLWSTLWKLYVSHSFQISRPLHESPRTKVDPIENERKNVGESRDEVPKERGLRRKREAKLMRSLRTSQSIRLQLARSFALFYFVFNSSQFRYCQASPAWRTKNTETRYRMLPTPLFARC